MRTLPIRAWLAIALVATFVAPAGAMLLAFRVNARVNPLEIRSRVTREVVESPIDVQSPTWQEMARTKMLAAGAQLIVADASGRELFRTGASPEQLETARRGESGVLGVVNRQEFIVRVPNGAGGQQYQQPLTLSIVNAEKFLPARGEVVRPNSLSISIVLLRERLIQLRSRTITRQQLMDLLVPLTGLGALLLVLSCIGWFIGRGVLRPLAAVSVAARQIAGGDLEFDLPASNVREVADVSTAFLVMGGALRESIGRQSELEQERRLFIGAIAHDLRTPLFSLRGYLEGLEKGIAATPEKAARYIAVCQEKAAALERLISDLFAYVQMEYLEQVPHWEQLDVTEVLRKATESLLPQAEAKGVTLSLDTVDAQVTVEGDPHLLVRAMENLLDNAVRHTPFGGNIAAGWRQGGGLVSLFVSDTGTGIAPRDVPHLFTPTYRGEVSRNRRTGGAGLGLSIARRIFLAHGGDLTAANRQGGGAIFSGTLPVAPPTTDATSAANQSVPMGAA